MIIPPQVKESVIRLMTRLAIQHQAVNLSQGFPNEPPPEKLRLALAHAVLSGKVYSDDEASRLAHIPAHELSASIVDLLTTTTTQSTTEDDGTAAATSDELNQYSPPMGRADVRVAISNYYQRLYNYDVSPDDITLTLGATEAVASALRTISAPGDRIVIFEPFHELYPSQCNIFYLDPVYITLHASVDEGVWNYNYDELKAAITDSKTKALILNTPHNPTGKIFSYKELSEIVTLCINNNVYIITDEIYEHMTYDPANEHILIPKFFPQAANLTLVCNSLGKSASATGWRIGWCIHPSQLSNMYRSVHDQMVAMAPHPQQFASLVYFTLPIEYFKVELRHRYQHRLACLSNALSEVGFIIVQPQGAYYLFVNYRNVEQLKYFSPMDAAMYMMRVVGVAVVPGDNFYSKSQEGQNYIRFAACRSVSDVTSAIAKMRSKLSKAI